MGTGSTPPLVTGAALDGVNRDPVSLLALIKTDCLPGDSANVLCRPPRVGPTGSGQNCDSDELTLSQLYWEREWETWPYESRGIEHYQHAFGYEGPAATYCSCTD